MLDSGELDIPSIAAGKQVRLPLPDRIFLHHSHNELILTISFRLKAASLWADASHEVAWSQQRLPQQQIIPAPTVLRPQAAFGLRVHSSKSLYSIRAAEFSLTFDRSTGSLTDWTVGAHRLLEPDPITNAALCPSFWRAPTDNDRPYMYDYWQRFGLDAMTSQLRSFSIREDATSGTVVLQSHTYLSPPILAWGFHAYTSYTITAQGALAVKISLKPTGFHPTTVPRIGLDVRVDNRLDRASWLGLGPGESYPDKRSSPRVGNWARDVAALHTPYEVPQENGNRMDTRWVKLVDPSDAGIRVCRTPVIATSELEPPTFSWAAGRHTPKSLEMARHPCDLVQENAVLWRVDADVAGLGTAACGPGVREQFEVKCQETEFEFLFETV